MRQLKAIIIFFLAITCLVSNAQNPQYTLVYFKDKNNNKYSLERPEEFVSQRAITRRAKQSISFNARDLPPSSIYIDSLHIYGANVKYLSRWLNAALIYADSQLLDKINSASFIKPASEYKKTNGINTKSITHNFNYCQSTSTKGLIDEQFSLIGLDQMHKDGLHGKGKLIAVLDAGFPGVNTIEAFREARISNRINAGYDFVNNTSDIFQGASHGTEVLSLMAGKLENDGFTGGATEADYCLIRTEDADVEDPIEEFYWLLGAEYADSVGADIINSSLGYNTFDNSSNDHSYAELDGKTTMISQAAKLATSTGILVVVSAGNEGDNEWKYIIAPADADSIIAVGSVDREGNHVNTSSIGPTFDKRIKPDVSACGSNVLVYSLEGNLVPASGTSFACPMVAALAAGIWQTHPDISNYDLIKIIKSSGSIYSHPDNILGYGIPNYTSVKNLLSVEDPVSEKEQLNAFATYCNSIHDNYTFSIRDIVGKVYLEGFNSLFDASLQDFITDQFPKGIYLVTIHPSSSTPKVFKIFVL